MSIDCIKRFEQLLERELSPEDKVRLLRIKDILGIDNNDALWDLLIAMDYQRIYYEELPKKIEQSTASILENISLAAKHEVALAQASLAESVVKQAKKLSTKEHIQKWLLWGSIALVLTIIYGSIMLWAGYGLGLGKIQDLYLVLRMPVGIVLGGCFFCGGIGFGVFAARAFAEVNNAWKKYMWIAMPCIVLGGVVLSISVK